MPTQCSWRLARAWRPTWPRVGIGIASLGLVLANCTSSPEAPARIRIAGDVRDSLNLRPVGGRWVLYGAASTIADRTYADSVGRFTLTVSPRPDTLVVPATAFYGEYRLALPGVGDTTLEIHLWRLVPYVTGFSVTTAGELSAIVMHQPGAARVLRDSASWMVYFSPSIGQSRVIPASEWTWYPSGAQQWRVSVQTGDGTVTSSLWHVSDSTFGAALARCVRGQGWCTDNVN
jgi:hypothetical protein